MKKIEIKPQEVRRQREERNLPRNFCPVPFTTLLLEPDGKVGSCRHKGSEFPVGNILNQSLMEIWNGDFIKKWRQEFLHGDAQICRSEIRHRACHLCPEYNELMSDVSLEVVQKRLPLRLGLNFNGKCNLECQMCHIWKKPNGLYDRIGFWKELEEYLPHLKEIELLSGEPFIQKDTYKLFRMGSILNPDIRWSITTNGHWNLTEKIKSNLDLIKIKHIILSLDSLVNETYQKIRKRGNLQITLKTLDQLIEYDQSRIERGLTSLNLHVNFLIQKDNWKELGQIHEFGRRKKIQVFRTFLYEPFNLSLLSLSEKEREEILYFYMSNLSRDQLKHSMRIILPLLDSLPPLVRGNFYLQLKETNAIL